MKLRRVDIKNFKSYGNATQTFTFNEGGELVLVVGSNGSGKSSIQEAIDWGLFGKVRGKRKAWTTQSSISNRINGETVVNVEFEANRSDWCVTRGLGPARLDLTINGIPEKRAGKSNIDNMIEDAVGMDIETFKSFVSMSVNDFKNFIALKPEDKRTLLDKLFSLGVIDEVSKIIKQMRKQTESDLNSYTREAQSLERTKTEMESAIQAAESAKKDGLITEAESIKLEMLNRKEAFDKAAELVKKITDKDGEVRKDLSQSQLALGGLESEMRRIKNELSTIRDKCPECGSELSIEHHLVRKTNLEESLVLIEAGLPDARSNVKLYNDRLTKLNEKWKEANQAHNQMKSDLSQMKMRLDRLKLEIDKPLPELDSLREELEKTRQRAEESFNQAETIREDVKLYPIIETAFSDEGIKRKVIASIIGPLNRQIEECIAGLNIPFQVRLDSDFQAHITINGEEIDPDTLSTGEMRKVNIAVMLAYVGMIRTRRPLNVLFLDEVFSSIDVDAVRGIISLLRNFAKTKNMSIILIHHAQLNHSDFDRIVYVEKEVFTKLTEVENKYEKY
jgi:exonuclease SbcC